MSAPGKKSARNEKMAARGREGRTHAAIAAEFGLTEKSVGHILRVAGVRRRPPPLLWPEPALARALKMLEKGCAYAQIARALSAEFGATFTRNAVIGKLARCAEAARRKPVRGHGDAALARGRALAASLSDAALLSLLAQRARGEQWGRIAASLGFADPTAARAVFRAIEADYRASEAAP